MKKVLVFLGIVALCLAPAACIAFAQDDGGDDGGNGGGEAVEADSGTDAMEADSVGDDSGAYEETYTEEAQYEEVSAPVGASASTITTTTHVYDRGSYVYDPGASAVVGAAAGAAAGAVAGSAVARSGKSASVPTSTIKKTTTDKTIPQASAKTAPQAKTGCTAGKKAKTENAPFKN